MSGAGSLMTHLHGVVGTRQVAVRYVVNKEARAALVSQLSSTLRDHVVAHEPANHSAPVSIRRAEPTVSAQEASSVAQSATALLDAELQVTVDGAAHAASKAQKASWIDFPVKERHIVPTVSQETANEGSRG